MTTERKPFAYVNKYTGKMFYLNEQPDAATDTDVYFPLWLHPQPFRENKESSAETIRKSEDSTTNANHIPDSGKMIIPDNVPCAGSPDFIWLQVGCDSGEPNVWPERAWDHVTWNDDRIHNDDVLYVNASLIGKPSSESE